MNKYLNQVCNKLKDIRLENSSGCEPYMHACAFLYGPPHQYWEKCGLRDWYK
jgi:hypothetical protein